MNLHRLGWLGGALFLTSSASAYASDYTVRLRVLSDRKQVTVEGEVLSILDGDVRDVLARKVRGPVVLSAHPGGLNIPGLKISPRSVILTAENCLIVEGRSLVGTVEVRTDEQGCLQVINRIPLERYLEGLLGVEMGPDWPIEALRAQAVASRTFAVRRCLEREGEVFDLSTTTLDQVYRGITKEGENTREAVRSTAGEVLTHGEMPAEALFHACCGGTTHSAEEVFGQPVTYLASIRDPDCAGCPGKSWTLKVPVEKITECLARDRGWKGKVVDYQDGVGEGGGRGIELSGSDGQRLRLSNQEFRRLLGVDLIPSGNFSWKVQKNALVFQGRGRGHGVGMCQWGARGMAERGVDYRSILQRYYPGTELRRMY